MLRRSAAAACCHFFCGVVIDIARFALASPLLCCARSSSCPSLQSKTFSRKLKYMCIQKISYPQTYCAYSWPCKSISDMTRTKVAVSFSSVGARHDKRDNRYEDNNDPTASQECGQLAVALWVRRTANELLYSCNAKLGPAEETFLLQCQCINPT